VGLKRGLRLPIKGELANRFGAQRSGGGPSWKGLFIRSPVGQEVRAVAPGRVVFADWLRGFGNLLIIDHGKSYLTIYGNNESVLKQVGDTVGTGDTVATVGASGGNMESGLYFEIRHEGKAFDPMRWVSLK
jgi:septal ring factor EnvC (AmiA/AmiB activator)